MYYLRTRCCCYWEGWRITCSITTLKIVATMSIIVQTMGAITDHYDAAKIIDTAAVVATLRISFCLTPSLLATVL